MLDECSARLENEGEEKEGNGRSAQDRLSVYCTVHIASLSLALSPPLPRYLIHMQVSHAQVKGGGEKKR